MAVNQQSFVTFVTKRWKTHLLSEIMYNNQPNLYGVTMSHHDTPYILTFTDKEFHFLSDDLSEICLEDIAKALSHINRYTGHTKLPYSVAEHAIHVASILPPELQMMGLLHDGSEAYLNDISSPLKSLLPDYRNIEEHVQNKVWSAFGVTEDDLKRYEEVKRADALMYFAELQEISPTQLELVKDHPLVVEMKARGDMADMPYFLASTISNGLFKKVHRNISAGNYLKGPFKSYQEMVTYLMK